MASQAITTAEVPASYQSPEAERFGLMQRQSRMFAMSSLTPEALRKGTPEQAMANCYIAMSIADRMGEDRITVMQNIHIIHGTAGFKTSYMIARANSSGKFSEEIDWEELGEGPTLSVTAFATLAKSGRRVEMTVDMAMAKAEGWASNKKYTTMPKVMLRYRSAAFLIRLYAPEVMLGHQTIEEVEDVRYAGGPDLNARPLSTAMLLEQAKPADEQNDGTLSEENPTSAEGADDSQRGEAHNDAEPWAARRTEILDAFAGASTVAKYNKADALLVQHMQAFPDEVQAELEAAASSARALMGQGGEG